VGVIVVGNGVFFLFMYIGNSSDGAAYTSASKCASPTDAESGRGCRYTGQAHVVSTSSPVRLEVTVAFDALSGRTFTASFTVANEPDSTTLKIGGSVAAELWNGKVTRLASKTSDDDPETYTTTPYLIVALFSGVFALLTFARAIPLARRAWRGAIKKRAGAMPARGQTLLATASSSGGGTRHPGGR
jgi:hypothetical protein